MRKVWGDFSVGGGLNYNLSLTRTVKGTDQDRDWNNKFSTHDYNISLLIGGIFDHDNGSRSILVFGPVYGGVTSYSKFDINNFDDNYADRKYSFSYTNDSLNLRAGVYHKLANTNLTLGLNAKTSLFGLFGRSGYRKPVTIMTSVGYAF